MGKLPDKNLFNSNSPTKRDQRKVVIWKITYINNYQYINIYFLSLKKNYLLNKYFIKLIYLDWTWVISSKLNFCI